ncbi:MAG: OB-fold domain-containing protein [bacterium]
MSKNRVAAAEGWFTMDADEPRLLGTRGVDSGSYFFPPSMATSANPAHPFEEREPVELSRRGRVWSLATNHYQPPEPYMSPEPFEPYTVLAVELEEEKMVILGQLADGVAPETVKVGDPVELVLGTLYEDDDNEYLVWKWQPATGGKG